MPDIHQTIENLKAAGIHESILRSILLTGLMDANFELPANVAPHEVCPPERRECGNQN